MDVKLESMVPLVAAREDIASVLKTVDKNGNVVLLADNRPAYLILKYDPKMLLNFGIAERSYTLHEAMQMVLREAEKHTMRASDLADEIYRRRLYVKKNGEKAEATQLRARCRNYQELFEPLPGSYIRLRAEPQNSH